MKHTPGPWDVFPNPTTRKITVGPIDHNNLVKCVAECYADEIENAHLIAAAPAMKQRLILAQRLLLQDDKQGALEEISAGIEGVFDSEAIA